MKVTSEDEDNPFQEVVRASLRRVSLGKAMGAVHPDNVNELLLNHRNIDEEHGESNDIKHQGSKLDEVDFHKDPRSLFNHTLRSNLDGFVTAALSLVRIIIVDFLVNALHSLGGVFDDMHAIRCTVCMFGLELMLMLASHGF